MQLGQHGLKGGKEERGEIAHERSSDEIKFREVHSMTMPSINSCQATVLNPASSPSAVERDFSKIRAMTGS